MNTENKKTIETAIRLLSAHSQEDFVGKAEAKQSAEDLQKCLYPDQITNDNVREAIVNSILSEVIRAEAKHPTWPDDKVYGAAIVSEESGEVMRACVQFEMEGGKIEEVKKELIQTAAVCIRMLSNIEYDEIH